MEASKILAFYQNENVLLSGGTGFMGTALIENLLRKTNVSKIYVLIRTKKEETANNRLLKLLENSVFDEVKKICPLYTNRVVAMSGDLKSENLSLSQIDQEILKSNVTIAFHMAASVRFFGPLNDTYESNIKGTERFLRFCSSIKNLKSVVYISTIFCHKFRDTIDEIVYDDCMSKQELENSLENLPDNEEEAKKIMEPFSCSYFFSKAVTERMLMDNEYEFPIAILRASLVSPAYKKPLKYWTQNFDALNCYLYFPSSGITPILPIFSDYLDLVPIDLVTNATVASAWHITLKNTKEKIVYNCISSADVGITYNEALEICTPHIRKNPPQQKIISNNFYLLNDSVITRYFMIFYHYLRAFLVDFFAICTLNRPGLTKKVRMMHSILDLARLVHYKKSKISNRNMKLMWQDMNDSDRKWFNFDTTTVQWLPYLRNLFDGVTTYLLKQ